MGHDSIFLPPTAPQPATWGLRADVLDRLLQEPPLAFQTLAARLAQLYAPDAAVYWMPHNVMQRPPARGDEEKEEESQDEDDEEAAARRGDIDCFPIVANACEYGDAFGWHVDADPAVGRPC